MLRDWARSLPAGHPEVIRVGCFGSYARDEHSPGSDLDVLIEVASSPHRRWFDRPLDFSPPLNAPVGIELFIYTSDELERMQEEDSPWLKRILSEAVWVYPAE